MDRATFRAAARYELWKGNERLGTAAQQSSLAAGGAGWYWYARNDKYQVPLMNTAATPVTTAEVAKQQCTEYVKTHLKEPQDEQ